MGSVKYGNVVVDVRGKVAGTVHGRNASGSITRAYVKPNSLSTNRQLRTRKVISSLTSQWPMLTDEEKASWIAGATVRPFTNRLGDQQFYTGQQLFLKANQLISMYQLGPLIRSCPLQRSIRLYEFTSFILSANAAGTISAVQAGAIDISPKPVPRTPIPLVFCTRAMSPGITRPKDSYFKFIQKGTNPAFASILTSNYRAIFGSAREGNVAWIKYIIVDPGTGDYYELGPRRTIVI